MARPPRIDPEGAIHHVTSRGNNRWPIFLDDADRRRFLAIVAIVCERYNIEVVAFALMDNHFHLVLRCPDAGLSAAMRDAKSQYGRWFHFRHGSSGPIYDQRFYSTLVTSHRQLKRLIRYVHRNPLAIDPQMCLAQYPWSSHAIYADRQPAPTWFNTDLGRSMFSCLRREVEMPLPNDDVQNRPPTAGEAMPGTTSLRPFGQPGLADIRIAVAHSAEVKLTDVHPTRRNGLIGIAVNLAIDEFGYSAVEVANPFGYQTPKAAASANHRARQRVAKNTRDADIRRASVARLTERAA